MLMNYNFACLSGHRVRAAAPAPAREILRAHTQCHDVDSVTGPEMLIRETSNPNLAEIRKRVQEGSYQVNVEEASASLVKDHLTTGDPYQR